MILRHYVHEHQYVRNLSGARGQELAVEINLLFFFNFPDVEV